MEPFDTTQSNRAIPVVTFSKKKRLLTVSGEDHAHLLPNHVLVDDYEITTTGSTSEALALLDSESDISLVLLNAASPEIDTVGFMGARRASKTLSRIPVIVATEVMNDQVAGQFYGLGAFEVIKVPCNPQMVPMRVARTIKLCESDSTLSAIEFDPATGLLNEHVFYHRAEQFAARSRTPLVVTVSEICHFSFIEKAYGRQKVAKVLAEVGGFLSSFSDYIVAGYLGNGKIGVIANWFEGVNFDAVAHSVKQAVSKGAIPELEIKTGICENAGVNEDIRESFQHAEDALASIRSEYNTSSAVYDEQLGKELGRRRLLSQSAKQSLDNGDFYVVYQPKFNIETRTVSGAEALVRWNHPTLGPVSPAEFIPLFEQSGFVAELDAAVRAMVRNDLSEWLDRGLSIVPISVNASRRELSSANVAHHALEEHGDCAVPFSMIHIEVTETMWTEPTETVIDNLNKLRQAGAVIELDDFGSGFSNLSMLAKLPIQVVKLDISLVREMPSSTAVVKHCIQMTHELGLKALAEGVEEEWQLQRLVQMGCDYAQGFYLSKPLSGEEFQQLLCQAG